MSHYILFYTFDDDKGNVCSGILYLIYRLEDQGISSCVSLTS